ncbi:MAG TPA: hypothetical protein VFJ07_16820 [Streptosporangiaceae bacterium]|nr:hypothetical protein [Streptosporangiaceae bacterium]
MTSPGESQAEPAVIDTRVGVRPVRPGGIVLLALVILGLLVFAVYCLIAVWPVRPGVTGPTISHVVGIRLSLDQEQRLFVVVAVTGALGGLIHSARSLYAYVGNRILLRSWLLFYLSLPLIGAGLAVLFYLILRGGLVTGTAAQVNFFGFAAISALVGLFTPEAALKLQQIFTTLLAPTPAGRDHLPPGTDPAGEVSPPTS